jgi:hypothetical protein
MCVERPVMRVAAAATASKRGFGRGAESRLPPKNTSPGSAVAVGEWGVAPLAYGSVGTCGHSNQSVLEGRSVCFGCSSWVQHTGALFVGKRRIAERTAQSLVPLLPCTSLCLCLASHRQP